MKCRIGDCGRPTLAKALCSTHYARWRKHGDPTIGGPLPVWQGTTCAVEDCDSPAHRENLCPAHYGRKVRHGDPLGGRRPKGSQPEPCAVDGCECPVRARGFCDSHYKRWRKHGDPLGGGRTPLRGRSAAERFHCYVDHGGPDDCWPWLAATNHKGYGLFLVTRGRSTSAHRFAYELANGSIPANRQVHHTCENKACMNPAHMQLLTPSEHSMISNAPRRKQTHCKRGHPLTPENVYDYPGVRMCKVCAQQRARERHARLRAT